VGPAGLTASKEIKHLLLSGTVETPDVSSCLSQPVVSKSSKKKPDFDPIEHSIYHGRRRLGNYVRVATRKYAAFDAKGSALGNFSKRKDAWTAISRNADGASR
jgi:hypothetical protein